MTPVLGLFPGPMGRSVTGHLYALRPSRPDGAIAPKVDLAQGAASLPGFDPQRPFSLHSANRAARPQTVLSPLNLLWRKKRASDLTECRKL
jgi:hypothetical protein